MFSCDYCNENVHYKYLITLPCGYLVCYEHFLKQSDPFTCFMCQEHLVEKNVCFSMKKNRAKIYAINNIRPYESKFLPSKSDLRLKSDLRSKYDLRSIFDLQLKGFNLKKTDKSSTNLDKFNTNQIKTTMSRIEEIKSLRFVSDNLKFQFDGEEMIGKISNKLNSETKPLQQKTSKKSSQNSVSPEAVNNQQSTGQKSEKKSIPFTKIPKNNLISCEFSYMSTLEINKGELLSISKKNPKNLVIWNYTTNMSRELEGHGVNICLFKKGADGIIVSLSKDYQVRVWENEKCIKFYQIPKIQIYSYQIDSTMIIFYDTFFTITTRDLLTGQVIRSLQAHSSPVTCLRLIKQNRLLSCHEDKSIKLWDILIGKCVKQFESESKVICLDIIDRSEFITGGVDGSVCIRNIHSDILKQSKTSVKPVRFVKFFGKTKFLSYSDERLLSLWSIKGEVFSVDDRTKMEVVKYLDVLSDGKIVTCSQQGVATIWS